MMYTALYTQDMASMIRKQIYLDSDLEAEVKKIAEKNGVSEAHVIREAVAKLVQQNELSEKRRVALAAINEIVARAVERYEADPNKEPGTDRGWTRDEIYNEYLDRKYPGGQQPTDLQPGSEGAGEASDSLPDRTASR